MLTVPVDRVDIQKFDEAGAFYSIALKRHPNKHPLDKFLNEDKTIQASEMLSEFRDGVKKAVEKATDLPCMLKPFLLFLFTISVKCYNLLTSCLFEV